MKFFIGNFLNEVAELLLAVWAIINLLLRGLLCLIGAHSFQNKYYSKGHYDQEIWLECPVCGKQEEIEP